MKKLIYEHKEQIDARKKYVAELIATANQLLTRFKSKHNHFGQPIDENFAFELITNPMGTFDDLLRVNSPIKTVADKPLDIVALAKLVGIDRDGFIQDFTVIRPGSRDQFNRHGTMSLFKLADADKSVLKWQEGEFILDENNLALQLESYRVYAETLKQMREVEWWEGLCTKLNDTVTRGIISDSDRIRTADMFGLKVEGRKIVPDARKLGQIIKKMALVN